MLPLLKQNFEREDLFIDRYASLRDHALRLTNHNATEAEDLLHDAFIHFTLSQTPIEDIRNLDGYLYIMLRNLRLAHERQRVRISQTQFSLIDYDSAELALNSIDPRDTIKAQDELRWICRYAFIRKDSSKAGSVLILRFLHGYLPNEIALLLKSPRASVDKFLQAARREVKSFRQSPDSVSFLHPVETTEIPNFSFGQVSPDIRTEIRKTIFVAPGPDCPKPEIKELYSSDAGDESVATKALAHIATCSACLDSVNEALGLPSLASRTAATGEGSKGKGTGSGGGTGGGTGGGMGTDSANAFLRRSRKRRDQIFEHRPEELFIAINGFIVGAHRVNSELSELALSVGIDERIGFIEVFSQNDVRLLFQSVEPPPDGMAVQSAMVGLSHGRHLELSLDFRDTRPQLYAKYADPAFHLDYENSGAAESIAAASAAKEQKTGDLFNAPGVFGRLLNRFRAFDLRSWMQPARLTAVFAGLLIAALVTFKLLQSPTPITVADLMKQAALAEQQAATGDVVIHKTYTIEERDGQGVLIATRKIDAYQSGEQKLKVRRQYDEAGKLIGGEWERGDGSRTLYSNKEKPRIERTAAVNGPPMSLDQAWQLDLSTADFQKLVSDDGVRITEDTSTYYTVVYGAPSSEDTGGPQIANASIKFSKDDLRAIEQMIEVRQGDQQRQFRYVEASYQKLSAQNVKPSVFEPDRDLLTVLMKDLKIVPWHETIEVPSVQPSTMAGDANSNIATAPATTATADLEVEALNLLSQAGADTGEQVEVKRSGNIIRIDGLVESENRKRELINALGPISGHPAVRVNIMTVAEALQKEQSRKTPTTQKGQTTVERFDTSGGAAPAKDKLRSYFGTEEAANNFAARMIARSRSAMSRAGAMKRLIGQFSTAELKTLSPDARAKWLNLVRSHARAFQQEIAAVRQDLTPVFGGGAGGVGAPTVDDDAELIRAVNRLFELGSLNDRAVRAALSISSDGVAGNLGSDFFRSLRTTEDIAAAIERIK